MEYMYMYTYIYICIYVYIYIYTHCLLIISLVTVVRRRVIAFLQCHATLFGERSDVVRKHWCHDQANNLRLNQPTRASCMTRGDVTRCSGVRLTRADSYFCGVRLPPDEGKPPEFLNPGRALLGCNSH